MKLTLFVAVVLFATSRWLVAQEQRFEDCLIATSDLALRKAPPSGLFYKTGEMVGTVTKGDTLVAKDRKSIKTLFGDYGWVKADVMDGKTEKVKGQGWVYTGKAGGEALVASRKACPSP